MINKCYEKSIEILKDNSTRVGFKASSTHYEGVWGRDGCITVLGACLAKEKELLKSSKLTLETLKKFQSPLGQIPNSYSLKKKRVFWGRSGCTDASLWYIIASYEYFKATEDKEFLKKHLLSMRKAINWLRYQDQNSMGLIDSPQAGDWMDSTILRCGKLLYNNVLWYKSLRCLEELGLGKHNADKVKLLINKLFWPEKEGERSFNITSQGWLSAYKEMVKRNRKFYLSHVSCERFVALCDTLANSLAIIWGVADKTKREKILNYFAEKNLSSPYPIRVLDPPLTKGGSIWQRDLERLKKPHHQSWPYCYHNAGIWPYVGGFYILALLKAGRRKKALEELRKLAEANKVGRIDWEFNEWLHGKTAKPQGQVLQSWNAGMYIAAYKAVVERKQAVF